MFKLIKIRGSRTNVPETEIVPIGSSSYVAGTLCYIADSIVSTSPLSENDVKFIPLESVNEESGRKTIRGYIVNEDMVFETEIYGNHESVSVGMRICTQTDDNDNIVGVYAAEGSDAILLNKDDVKNGKKVLVALKG